MARTLHIASIASEVSPYSKTGGLADVAKSLPKALSELGHQVSIITPYYSFIEKQGRQLEAVDKTTSISFGRQTYNISFKKLDFSNTLKIYFVVNKKLFGRSKKIYGYPNDNLRFLIFGVAALRLLELKNLKPHIIHCHDWQAGLIPNILKKDIKKYPSLKRTPTIFTIHNLTFQSGADWWGVPGKYRDDGRSNPLKKHTQLKYLNFTKRAIFYSDIITTVSERYAEEITRPELGQNLDVHLRHRKKDLYGIVNGIDYTVNNPAFDDNIAYKYDWNSLRRKKRNKLELQKIVGLEKNADIPLIGIVHRLTEQKGFKLIMETIGILMRLNLQMVIVGSGSRNIVSFFRRVAKRNPKRLAFYTPFTEELESKVYAGSDMFLMPSRFEPCGISQLKSLRYGSVPIVNETGGLSDTITNFSPKTRKGNGFVFRKYTTFDFIMALTRALENYKYTQTWEYLTWQAMQQSYSWEIPAKKYLRLFNIALKNKRQKK